MIKVVGGVASKLELGADEEARHVPTRRHLHRNKEIRSAQRLFIFQSWKPFFFFLGHSSPSLSSDLPSPLTLSLFTWEVSHPIIGTRTTSPLDRISFALSDCIFNNWKYLFFLLATKIKNIYYHYFSKEITPRQLCDKKHLNPLDQCFSKWWSSTEPLKRKDYFYRIDGTMLK